MFKFSGWFVGQRLYLSKNIICLFMMIAFLGGCASQKAGMSAPELPARHWLESAPGVPVEHKAKLEASMPNLYNSDKAFSFDDSVYLAIQQSPLLANSAVSIEMSKLKLVDAVWQYLPEPTISLDISNNITALNTGLEDLPADYAKTKMRVAFNMSFPNPVSTYFNHKSKAMMIDIALSTHRKAIAEAILNIAGMYQQLEAKRKTIALQEQLLPIAKKLIEYWQQLEAVEGKQGASLNIAIQQERERQLELERNKIEDLMLRTKLKSIVGVELEHKFNVDTTDAKNILQGFDGEQLHWEEHWNRSEDALLLRGQIALMDLGIMLAWAEYIPDIAIRVDNNPPAGQYQPVDGQEDTFVHLNLQFPLIDWGRRYRGVQTARMEKAQAFQEQAQARTEFSHEWIEGQQMVKLAENSLKIAQNNLKVSEMLLKEKEISFNDGVVVYPELASAQADLIAARISLIMVELDYDMARIKWMDVAGLLSERFLGLPASEEF